MEGHHHHQQQQLSTSASDSRFPQWSVRETRDFLAIRAELDRTFMETQRNKVLWEVVATRMRERGFNRTADQCKCKWKNLVTRYKGFEIIESEGMRHQQFPFYNELQAIFASRMQRMLWIEADKGAASGSLSKKKDKGVNVLLSSDEEDNEQNNQDSDGEGDGSGGLMTKKKRKFVPKSGSSNISGGSGSSNSGGLKEVLEEFMQQQMEMEMQWLRAYAEREEERRVKEMEWRQALEALDNERLLMERRWREREEERRMREEARAEKRDALVTLLLNKLGREGDT